jgi:hypothetical protein
MLNKGQIAGIIAGSIIAIGIILGVLLFMLAYLRNRRIQRNVHEPTNERRTWRDRNFHGETNADYGRLQQWTASEDDQNTVATSRWVPLNHKPDRWTNSQGPKVPWLQAPNHTTTVAASNEGTAFDRYSFHTHGSPLYSIPSDNDSVQDPHKTALFERTPIDRAFDDLATELVRGTRAQSTQRMAGPTPTVFPRDIPMQSMGFDTPVSVSQRSGGSAMMAQSYPPPRARQLCNGGRPLTPGRTFNSRHSRLPEGAFF